MVSSEPGPKPRLRSVGEDRRGVLSLRTSASKHSSGVLAFALSYKLTPSPAAAILPLLPLDVPLLIIASDLGYFGSELKRALEALEDAGEAANTASAREAEVQASEERAREAMRRLEEEYQGRLEGVGREARFVDGRSEE